MAREYQYHYFGVLTKEQNFKGVISFLINFRKTLKNRDYNTRRALKSAYGYQLQERFFKAVSDKIYGLTLQQSLFELYQRSSNTELYILKRYIYKRDNIICNGRNISLRTEYRILNRMWSKYLEIYRELSTSIHQR